MLLKNSFTIHIFKTDKNIIVHSPILNKFKFHTSTFNYSDKIKPVILDNILDSNSERQSQLQLIKYKEKVDESDISDILGNPSSYPDNFPWLLGADGKALDFNQNIDVFNAVKMVSLFLEKRFDLDKDQISNVKISQILEPFKDNENVTVLELFNHFSRIYDNNKDSLIKDFVSELKTNSLIENKSVLIENMSQITHSKPLGAFGETTLNEVTTGLMNLKWEVLFNSAKVTLNAAPLVMNLASYTFMLKGFMKYVHNRPYDTNLDATTLARQKLSRNRHLILFSLLGAPVTLLLIKANPSFGFRQMLDISFFGTSGAEGGGGNSNTNLISNSSFLLLLSKINNKIPSTVKLAFKLVFFIILILKLLGYNILTEAINDISFLKNFIYIFSSLVIFYDLLNLYLIHKFATKNVKISEVLPDFIINWLKEFEVLSSTKISIKEFKKENYINISIYVIIMIVITLL